MWDDDGGAGEIGSWKLEIGVWSLEFGVWSLEMAILVQFRCFKSATWDSAVSSEQ